MKNFKTIAVYTIGGILLLNAARRWGYIEGVQDVLERNDIDNFTKDCKNGYSITISKKKGLDK